MINLNVERDFHLYRKRLAENPNAVAYPPLLASGFAGKPMHVVQYHNTGKEIFGAVLALLANNLCRDFRGYLPKVDLN